MKNKMQFIRKRNDEYNTPVEAVVLIEKYLKPCSLIWCPFDKDDSNFVIYLRSKGHKVVNTHIDYGQDFLKCNVKTNFDYIISNPPFSIKDEIFDKLFKLNISFAMLMNIQGVADSKKRFELFKSNGIEIMYIYPRINYIQDHEVIKGSIFQSGYICKNILPDKLVFEGLHE